MNREVFLSKMGEYGLRWYFEYCIYINETLSNTSIVLKVVIKLIPIFLILLAGYALIRLLRFSYRRYRYDLKELESIYTKGKKTLKVKGGGNSPLFIYGLPKDKTQAEWQQQLDKINTIMGIEYNSIERQRGYVKLFNKQYKKTTWKDIAKIKREPYEVIFGFDENGKPVKANIRLDGYFTFICGRGGTGKSIIVNSAIRQLIEKDIEELYLLDAKGVDFSYLDKLPEHLRKKITILNPLIDEERERAVELFKEIRESGIAYSEELKEKGLVFRDVIAAKESGTHLETLERMKTRMIVLEESPQYCGEGDDPELADLINKTLKLMRYSSNFIMMTDQSPEQMESQIRKNLFTQYITADIDPLFSKKYHHDSALSVGAMRKGLFALTNEKTSTRLQCTYVDQNDFEKQSGNLPTEDISRCNDDDEKENETTEARQADPTPLPTKKINVNSMQNLNSFKNDDTALKEKDEQDIGEDKKIVLQLKYEGQIKELKLTNKPYSQKMILSLINRKFTQLEKENKNDEA
jgi:hypothetical protein